MSCRVVVRGSQVVAASLRTPRPLTSSFLSHRSLASGSPLYSLKRGTTRYTQAHEWARLETDLSDLPQDANSLSKSERTRARMGITSHAASALGDVVYVELPELGTLVSQGDQIGAIESVKAASDIYAPVSGEIVEVNDKLTGDDLKLVNKSPEGEGWICQISLTKPGELDNLLNDEAYKALVDNAEH